MNIKDAIDIFGIFKWVWEEFFSKWFSSKKKNKVDEETINNSETNPLELKEVYYFEDYCKHVTIYRDGHGILINKIKIKILDKQKFEFIKRAVSIYDGKKNAFLKTTKEITNPLICSRFRELGFWYQFSSNVDNKVLDGIEDWIRDDNKDIEFIFKFNKAIINSLDSDSFTLTYALSVPGMFPIQEGYLDEINLPNNFKGFQSTLEINERIENLTYILSFERGVEVVKDSTKLYVLNSNESDKISLKPNIENEVFYNKFIMKSFNPHIGDKFFFSWDIEKRRQKEWSEKETDGINSK